MHPAPRRGGAPRRWADFWARSASSHTLKQCACAIAVSVRSNTRPSWSNRIRSSTSSAGSDEAIDLLKERTGDSATGRTMTPKDLNDLPRLIEDKPGGAKSTAQVVALDAFRKK